MTDKIAIDGSDLTIDSVWRVAVEGANAELSQRARGKMKATQKVVADIVIETLSSTELLPVSAS